MAKPYPHQIAVPKILIDSTGARTVGATGVLPAMNPTKTVGAVAHAPVDRSAPTPLQDSSVGSSVIFSLGGQHIARGPGEGE